MKGGFNNILLIIPVLIFIGIMFIIGNHSKCDKRVKNEKKSILLLDSNGISDKGEYKFGNSSPIGETPLLKQFSTFHANTELFNTHLSSSYKKEPYVFLKHSVKEGAGTNTNDDINDDINERLWGHTFHVGIGSKINKRNDECNAEVAADADARKAAADAAAASPAAGPAAAAAPATSGAGSVVGGAAAAPAAAEMEADPPKEFPLAQTDTWEVASTKCKESGKKLCTKDQICKNDKPIFNGKTADTWTPIAGTNTWLQIGTDDNRLCETHPLPLPGWGRSSAAQGFRNTLICCD